MPSGAGFGPSGGPCRWGSDTRLEWLHRSAWRLRQESLNTGSDGPLMPCTAPLSASGLLFLGQRAAPMITVRRPAESALDSCFQRSSDQARHLSEASRRPLGDRSESAGGPTWCPQRAQEPSAADASPVARPSSLQVYVSHPMRPGSSGLTHGSLLFTSYCVTMRGAACHTGQARVRMPAATCKSAPHGGRSSQIEVSMESSMITPLPTACNL